MVRYHKIKGVKRKKTEGKYERDETEQIVEEDAPESTEDEVKAEGMSGTVEERGDAGLDEFPGIPLPPSDGGKKPGVIFILENASLEVAKVGKNYELLNSDKHAHFLQRHNRNPADYRPDIAHQAILMILDSRINKSGRLKALYVRTQKDVLFEISPHVRIPRTYVRFAGVILQLLQKLSITAVGKRDKLLKTIKNPVTQYLPIDSRKIGFSHSSNKVVNIQKYVNAVSDELDLVFVVGAMAHGKIENDYVEDYISVSNYPLSAAYCISMITNAVEQKWSIL
ncbi:hypothetical protein Leryth_007650 [Lithospermum erythrorhizon]|nr:hypothetical protein Leryth_007650 [Lithospermum erythrorhizon]